jgi:predicted nuclease of predicted toxin-antitoxin system
LTEPKFLIDENLSITLPPLAHARGYEATHVARRGLRQRKDWELMDLVACEDWVLVTNNAVEFRGRYRRIEVHSGVIFLVPSVRRTEQRELFEAALDEVDRDPDMINTAMDIFYADDLIVVRRYSLP